MGRDERAQPALREQDDDPDDGDRTAAASVPGNFHAAIAASRRAADREADVAAGGEPAHPGRFLRTGDVVCEARGLGWKVATPTPLTNAPIIISGSVGMKPTARRRSRQDQPDRDQPRHRLAVSQVSISGCTTDEEIACARTRVPASV